MEEEIRMRYLSILEELFESDTVIILVIGLAAALLLGFGMKSYKKLGIGAGISLLVYVVCEVFSNLHGTYLMQILLLVLGTAAIGCLAGFGLCALLTAVNRR